MAVFLPIGTDKYKITSTHGEHHGIDYAVPYGTPAVSTVNGVVESVRTITTRRDPDGSYGMYVVIRDHDGNRHFYAHLSAFSVRPGQAITAGQPVGATGNSGNTRGATGNHLHYEVRDSRGNQINPAYFTGEKVSETGPGDSYTIADEAYRRGRVHIATSLPQAEDTGLLRSVGAALGWNRASLIEDTITIASAWITESMQAANDILGLPADAVAASVANEAEAIEDVDKEQELAPPA